MFKRFVFTLAIALVVLAAIPVHPAYAQKATHQLVICPFGICTVLTSEEISGLKAEADSWGLFVSNGQYQFRYSETWMRLGDYSFGPTELVPGKIFISRDGFTDIPQMGLYVKDGVLTYKEPGYLLNAEVPIPLPRLGGWQYLSEGAPEETWTSYSNDGSRILAWSWTVEWRATQIVLHIYELRVGFLNQATELPTRHEYTYDLPVDIDWIPGEELKVITVNANARTIPAVNENGEANYKNTFWSATIQWTDNYVFQRADGSLFRISDNNLMASRACTPDKHCYSTGYYPKAGESVYVYPYTLWDIADWKESGNPQYANLWVLDVSPARNILPQDQALIDQRLAAGEIELMRATVIDPVDQDNSRLVGTDNGVLNLPLHYMPPVGTRVLVYVYNEAGKAATPYLDWDVMALFDANGRLWFFNSDAEYGRSFDAEVYNLTP